MGPRRGEVTTAASCWAGQRVFHYRRRPTAQTASAPILGVRDHCWFRRPSLACSPITGVGTHFWHPRPSLASATCHVLSSSSSYPLLGLSRPRAAATLDSPPYYKAEDYQKWGPVYVPPYSGEGTSHACGIGHADSSDVRAAATPATVAEVPRRQASSSLTVSFYFI